MKRTIALTGDRPTGALHIGHYAGSLANRLTMQADPSIDLFVMAADGQAYTDHQQQREKVRESIREVVLDYIAVGIDPAQSTIFLQSEVPELFELAFHFLNLVNVSRLERNPTVRQEIRAKFGQADTDFNAIPRHIPAGFLAYPVSQAADILGMHGMLIPVGEDQLPMIEQANEIAETVLQMTGIDVFPRCKAVVSQAGRLPGIDGKAKMSKSLGNTLPLGASPADIDNAVRLMYTDANHIKVSDPGQVEGNVVFTYLDAFDTRREEVDELKAQYRAGGLGDVKVKTRLRGVLHELMTPIRARREYAAANVDTTALLRAGSDKAREHASHVLKAFRRAMGIGL